MKRATFPRAASRRIGSALLLSTVATIAVTGVLAPAAFGDVTNGSFSTGNFTGWTAVNQRGGDGNWFVYSGRRSPVTHTTVPAPPDGTYAATTDQEGPGAHVLYQDFTVPPFEHSTIYTLHFTLYYHNFAHSFENPTPESLDYKDGPNQQYRVDLMKTTASPSSVATNDVLENVFQTTSSSPRSMAPTAMTFDVTPWAGKTIRLRFAETDDVDNLLASVDGVFITTGPGAD